MVDATSDTYNTEAQQLQSAITTFNSRAERGDFASPAQFQNERTALANRVNSLNRQRESINDMIVQYNDLREQYNQTITESNGLYKSLDSKLTTAPQV